MFDTLQDAVNFADQQKQRNNDGGVPRFFKEAVAKRKGTEVEWEDEIWVEIFNKGDSKNVIIRPKRDEDEKRWPEFWKAFLNNEDPDIDGVPLADFPKITPAERERCKAKHLLSVEDLINFPDAQIHELGGRGHELKKAAQEFLDYKEGKTIAAFQDTIKELQARIEELEKELDSGTDSTSDDSERGAGDKPAETLSPNERWIGA